jgi:hypothetical protein
MEPRHDSSSDDRRMRAQVILLCGAVMAVGLAISAWTEARAAVEPVMLRHLSEAHIVEIRDARGQGVLSGEFRSRTDTMGNVEKDAALADARGNQVIGEIELEFPHQGRADRRPELEVDVIGLPRNQRFTIVVDNQPVGVFTTDDRGSADLEIQEGEILPGQ